MNHTLDYFIEFLDNPDVLDDLQYSKMFDEWIEYLQANSETLDFLDEDWRERRERLHIQYEKRLYITPEIKKEFEEINSRLKKLKKFNDKEKIALFRDHLNFITKYKAHYRFSDEAILRTQKKYDNYKRSIEAHLIAKDRLEQIKNAENATLNKLEEAIFEEYERTGKMPVLTSHLLKKPPSGN